MVNKRPLAWSVSLRDLRNSRIARAGIREERLRATSGLRDLPPLTSWRGRSGRRYVVGVHPLSECELAEVSSGVVFAVQRSGDAVRVLAGTLACDGRPASRIDWVAAMRAEGATELHVHRLADGEEARLAVLADLT